MLSLSSSPKGKVCFAFPRFSCVLTFEQPKVDFKKKCTHSSGPAPALARGHTDLAGAAPCAGGLKSSASLKSLQKDCCCAGRNPANSVISLPGQAVSSWRSSNMQEISLGPHSEESRSRATHTSNSKQAGKEDFTQEGAPEVEHCSVEGLGWQVSCLTFLQVPTYCKKDM